MVVATVRSLQGLSVEEFANRLFRHWQLGGAEEDNGALLLVAPNERKVRIEVGYGLEGVLTDAAASTIIQSLVLPRFRAGDLQGGVEAGARGMLELLRPEGEAAPSGWAGQPRPQEAQGIPWPTLVIFGFVAFLLLCAPAAGPSRASRPLSPQLRRAGFGYPPVIVVPGGFGGAAVRRVGQWRRLLGRRWQLRRRRRLRELVMRPWLTEDELGRLEAAVRNAERGTTAEIVVVIAGGPAVGPSWLLWPAFVALAVPLPVLLVWPGMRGADALRAAACGAGAGPAASGLVPACAAC